jgi:tetratricopeptide (TPR) repeat protein
VESVAWVTELKNTLSLVLILAAAHTWLSWRTAVDERDATPPSKANRKLASALPAARRPGLLWAVALTLFTLALLAKTTASVLPAVLLVIVWWQRGRLRWPDVRPMLPFFAIGAGLAFHTAWLERTMVRATGSEWALGLLGRLVLAGQVTAFYAWKVLWPVDLAFSYPRWTVDLGNAAQWIPTAAAFAALVAAWKLSRRGRRGPLAGLLLFGGVLFPAMGFFNVYAMRYSWVADHFAYQAVAVAATCVACGISSALEGLRLSWRKPAAAAGAAGLLVLGTLSFRQGHAYETQETLWLDTLAKNPECFLCLTNYGRDLLQAGRTDEAVTHLERSLQIKPDAVPTLLNLAGVEEERGHLEAAARHLRAALAVDSTDDEIRVHLATVYTKAGRLDDAIREFRVALARPSPEDFLAHNGLGVALIRTGRVAEGIEHMKECVRLRPDYEHGRANLERALALTGGR